ncbi:MAG: nuclear transport factor 2 family protein [Pseudomonadota bacterium]
MELNLLVQIEEIKKLKARYFRFLDKKLWNEWADLFTEDATLQYGPKPKETLKGREQILTQGRIILGDAKTVHHGHMPEIELTSDTTATGIWAMFDYVQLPARTFKGYGHYEEEYVKEDGRWKIKSLRLTRLHMEVISDT